MKRLAVTIVSLALLSSACAQANRASAIAASHTDPQTIAIARSGTQPSRQGPVENFTGSVRVEPLFNATAPARASAARVSFERGARTAWHTHPLGQRLVVTAGAGWIQQWGGPIQEIRPGDVVWIPPGQKHWHGASATSSMTHIAIQEHLDGKTVDWMEHVTEGQYDAGTRSPAAAGTAQPTPAQRLIGDFAPKLVELTDRPEQLRSHLVRARDNGVTQEELIETITHLAFYSGWPNAITAITVAKEVFEKR